MNATWPNCNYGPERVEGARSCSWIKGLTKHRVTKGLVPLLPGLSASLRDGRGVCLHARASSRRAHVICPKFPGLLQPPNGHVCTFHPSEPRQAWLKVGAAGEHLGMCCFPSICRTACVPAADWRSPINKCY